MPCRGASDNNSSGPSLASDGEVSFVEFQPGGFAPLANAERSRQSVGAWSLISKASIVCYTYFFLQIAKHAI